LRGSFRFFFRLAFATPIILAKKNEIRFQIGIEVSGETAWQMEIEARFVACL
jgi:hypothetical protein